MKTVRRAGLVLGVSALLAGLGLGSATAQAGTTPGIMALCAMDVGSITAQGIYTDTVVSAGAPPAASAPRVGPAVAKPGETKASTTWEFADEPGSGTVDRGYAIYGTELDSTLIARPAGGPWWGRGIVAFDWNDYTAVVRSAFPKGANPTREYFYAVRADGVLARFKKDNQGFHPLGTYAGLKTVKTVTVISQTASYDTLLVTTKAGALSTIRIPVTSPMTPVVKVVRGTTWQGFEAIVAEKCGTSSTLLTAIDRETGSAYLYAVGHATGTTTAIQALGKIPGTFNDPVYFLRSSREGTPLNGE
ncbi:hypothetical protein [Streptomyces sp. SID13031]|uniref:hypothetical protein n=1 Tax=Streptomyces sp. SID13031 TaxID=2706046 RepID=UPI0013C72178|nr:hypothetical protein [Streptomyces sp. SID13031]NEA32290.1 hypothetical protein [Streptomyces sp. SID13031]